MPEGEVQYSGGTATPYYYEQDHLGSVISTTSATGTTTGTLATDAYGVTLSSSGTLPTFGYAGMFLHQPSGMYLTAYRAYDPYSGRWLSRDPAGEAGGLNLFGYVGETPINGIDPSGLFAFGGGDAEDLADEGAAAEEGAELGAEAGPEGALAGAALGLAFCYLDPSACGLPQGGSSPTAGSGDGGPNGGAGCANGSGNGEPPAAAGGGNGGGAKPPGVASAVPSDDPQQNPVPGTSKQFGKKFGQHMDPSTPGYQTPQQYQDLANKIYNDPESTVTPRPNGETWYQLGNDLLRLDPFGNFRSLYPIGP